MLAAVLAIGEDALLDDMSAAHLWGFWPYLKESRGRPRRGRVMRTRSSKCSGGAVCPAAGTNTGIPGLPSWIEVNVHFPDHGLVIEVDSAFYDTRIWQEDDADKQAILEAHGLAIMRLRKIDAAPTNEPGTVARIRRPLLELG